MTLRAREASVDRRLAPTTLALTPGTLTCVVGENGAGKSTLLDVLAGILVPHGGEVLLDDTALSRLAPRERARRIASLGAASMEIEATAGERIAQGLAPRRGSGALIDMDAAMVVGAVAEELGVTHLLDRDLTALSHGERRRVEVARALVDAHALAYVVDEPHAGVDIKHQVLVSDALRARAQAGKIVIASVHELGVAAAIAHRVLGMREGKLVVDGSPAQALTGSALEVLYGVSGARVLCEPEGVAVLLPRTRSATRRG